MDTSGAQRAVLGLGAVIGIGVGLAAATVVLAGTPPTYESTASVLVQQIGSAAPALPTEAQLALSTKTAADAARTVGRSTEDIAASTSVQPLDGTSVLQITVRADSATAAQAGARAVAAAYLANRGQTAQVAIADQLATLRSRIVDADNQVNALNAQMAKLPASSPDQATLRGSLALATTQLTALSSRQAELQTTPVDPGRIIGDPDLPAGPVAPRPWLYRGVGAGAGALLGLVAALVRRRLTLRVRDAADVERRGVPVLAHVLTAERDGGRTFSRLRNEVIAALGTNDRVLLVAGASPGPASTVVTANLAAAFARSDTEVILVGANAPDPATPPLSQLFDVADIPGLSDVLTGRVALPAGLQRAARLPRLRVITPGGTASAAGLLQSEGARSAVHALRGQARYVVVEAPSTAAGADAQSLARAADAAILVVEAGRSRHAEVADAATQLRLVGARLLGAVLLSPAMPPPADDEDGPRGLPPRRLDPNDEWLGQTPSIVDAPTERLRQIPTAHADPAAAAPPR
jgi:Mrp family chromosome partitioning ATPase